MSLFALAAYIIFPTCFVVLTSKFPKSVNLLIVALSTIIFIWLATMSSDITQGLEEASQSARETGKSMLEVAPGSSTSGLAVGLPLFGYLFFLAFVWIAGKGILLFKKFKSGFSSNKNSD